MPDSKWNLDDDEYDCIDPHNRGVSTITAIRPSSLVSPELINESLREYVNNVVKIQYLLGDNAILPNMIWEAITVHEESREAVNLLSQIYSKRRQDPLRQVLSDIPFKCRVEGLQATLVGKPVSSADDAMAALHVVSVFLFDGGKGAWNVFLDIASVYVMALLENPRYHRNYAAALQACGPKEEFIVKTTIWFDVIGSITTQEQPRLLSAIRELFDPNRSFIGGHPNCSSYSMMSPMGCENVVVWALAEASSLSCWKRSNKRKGTLSQRELVRRVEDIENHLEPQPPQPQPHLENPEEWSRLLASRIFRSATKLFLQSILHGDHPRVPELRRCVDETFNCIVDFPSPVTDNKPAIVRSTVFGIFLCGSLMDDPVKKRLLSLHLQQEAGADGVGNTSTVLRLLQQLWETRRRSPKSSVPWREQLKEAQILLV